MEVLNFTKLSLGAVITTGLLVLGGCGAGPASSENTAASPDDVPIAYVKRPLNPQAMDSPVGNPTDSVTFHLGGDLYVREISSASAVESNITSAYTQGRGDVSDPEVSYDGKKILFSMKGPGDSTWNIWEYNRDAKTLLRIIRDNAAANQGDDVDPAYLPDGRIVFSSNRQHKSVQMVGYRQWMCGEALALGVTGWVRNRRDGGVEAVIDGAQPLLRALIERAHRGPPAAKVDTVTVAEIEGRFTGFEWRPTA